MNTMLVFSSTSFVSSTLFFILLIFLTSLIGAILVFISCSSLDDLLFIHLFNYLFDFCIHSISNLNLPFVHILCSIIHVATILVKCCNDVLALHIIIYFIFPLESQKHVPHTCKYSFK